MISELRESARRLQAQSGQLMYQLNRPTVDLALVVSTLSIIEDTARETIEAFHQQAKEQQDKEV